MTSPDVPRVLPSRVQRDRVKRVARRMAPGSDDGGSGMYQPVIRPPKPNLPPIVTSLDMNPVQIGEGTVVTPPDGSGVGVGVDCTVDGDQSAGGGYLTNITGAHCTGWGYIVALDGDFNTGFGASLEVHGTGSSAFGYASGVWGDESHVVGDSSSVGTSLSPADNAAAIGHNVHAPNTDDYVLGNSANNVQVPGALIIADNVGGLHRLVVSTGGVLSTVPFP